MIPTLQGLSLPITQKLIPRRGNLMYLAETAVLTRLAIAAARTWQNVPSKNHSPDQSLREKYNSLWERFFVEIFGTAGYMLTMHLGQDLAAKLLEAPRALDPKRLIETIHGLEGVATQDKTVIAKAIEKVYGDSSKGILSRALYDSANLSSLWKVLDRRDLINHPGVRTTLEEFAMKLNRASSLTLLSGIATGVLFGGVIIQWLNDRVVSPLVEPFLARLFKLSNNEGYTGTELQRTFRC